MTRPPALQIKKNYCLFLSLLLFGSYRCSIYVHCHCTTTSVKDVESAWIDWFN